MTFHVRAPMRIDLAGGWSDVPHFADVEGGAVVNAAITLYAHVECTLGGGAYRLLAEDMNQRVFIQSPSEVIYDGKLDLHKAALNMLPVPGGVEIITSLDVPAGSGLGGSGSLDVALLKALALTREENFDQEDLAEMGYVLEATELGLAGGRQDQYAAALGGFHRYKFASDPTVEVHALDLGPDAARDFAKHVCLVYTGQTHFSSATHERVWRSYRDGDGTVAAAIRAMRDLVGPLANALEAGDWKKVASLVGENWRQQQLLDETISTSATQDIERAVSDAGAWGVKATGAGAGGCLVVIGPDGSHSSICSAAEQAGGSVLDWEFDFEGVTGWRAAEDADHSS